MPQEEKFNSISGTEQLLQPVAFSWVQVAFFREVFQLSGFVKDCVKLSPGFLG
jgi:hypothetical protein